MGRSPRVRRKATLVVPLALAIVVALLTSVAQGSRLSAEVIPDDLGLGPAQAFPFGLYVATNATMSGDVTGAASVGGLLTVPAGTSLTVGQNCDGGCPLALVAPSVARGSRVIISSGDYAVSPAPSSTTFTLFSNGSGTLAPASATEPLNFGLLTHNFASQATMWSHFGASGTATYSNGGSVLNLVGRSSTLNIFDLTTSILAPPATHITVALDAPATSTVLINVGSSWGEDAADLTSFIAPSGVPASRVLWNFGSAGAVIVGTPQWYGSIFAPSATFTGGGQVDGDLIVGSLRLDSALVIPEVHDVNNLFTGTLPQTPPITAPGSRSTSQPVMKTTPTTPSSGPASAPARQPVTTASAPLSQSSAITKPETPTPFRLVTGPPVQPSSRATITTLGQVLIAIGAVVIIIDRTFVGRRRRRETELELQA